jgi:hypothetical protein
VEKASCGTSGIEDLLLSFSFKRQEYQRMLEKIAEAKAHEAALDAAAAELEE